MAAMPKKCRRDGAQRRHHGLANEDSERFVAADLHERPGRMFGISEELGRAGRGRRARVFANCAEQVIFFLRAWRWKDSGPVSIAQQADSGTGETWYPGRDRVGRLSRPAGPYLAPARSAVVDLHCQFCTGQQGDCVFLIRRRTRTNPSTTITRWEGNDHSALSVVKMS